MANGAMPVAVPGNNPGEVYIPALDKSFQQIELREDDVYDTIQIPAGTITAGTEFELFRDLQNKFEQHVSIKSQRKIPAGDECAVFRVGVHPRGAVGNTVPVSNDFKKILENGTLFLNFNRRQITNGPLIKYQSGYGLGGYSTENGVNSVTVGVPSAAAAPTLFVPQQLRDDDDINGRLRFSDAQWFTGYAAPIMAGTCGITLFLHSIIKSPLGK